MNESAEQLEVVTFPSFPFIPVAQYNQQCEFLYFLRQDVSCRTEEVDGMLELLWHPHKTEIIGIKVNLPAWGLAKLQTEGESTPVSRILNAVYALMKANYPESTRKPLDVLYRAARELVGDETLVYQTLNTDEH